MSGREQALDNHGWTMSQLVALPRSGAMWRGLAWEEMLAAAVPRVWTGWWTVWAECGGPLIVTGRTADLGLREKHDKELLLHSFHLGAVRIGGGGSLGKEINSIYLETDAV